VITEGFYNISEGEDREYCVFFKAHKTSQNLRWQKTSDTQDTKTHHKIILNIDSIIEINL